MLATELPSGPEGMERSRSTVQQAEDPRFHPTLPKSGFLNGAGARGKALSCPDRGLWHASASPCSLKPLQPGQQSPAPRPSPGWRAAPRPAALREHIWRGTINFGLSLTLGTAGSPVGQRRTQQHRLPPQWRVPPEGPGPCQAHPGVRGAQHTPAGLEQGGARQDPAADPLCSSLPPPRTFPWATTVSAGRWAAAAPVPPSAPPAPRSHPVPAGGQAGGRGQGGGEGQAGGSRTCVCFATSGGTWGRGAVEQQPSSSLTPRYPRAQPGWGGLGGRISMSPSVGSPAVPGQTPLSPCPSLRTLPRGLCFPEFPRAGCSGVSGTSSARLSERPGRAGLLKPSSPLTAALLHGRREGRGQPHVPRFFSVVH